MREGEGAIETAIDLERESGEGQSKVRWGGELGRWRLGTTTKAGAAAAAGAGGVDAWQALQLQWRDVARWRTGDSEQREL